MVDQSHPTHLPDLPGRLLITMHPMQSNPTELVEVLFERHERKPRPVLETEPTALLVVRLPPTITHQLASGRPLEQLLENHALQRLRKIRRDDPTVKRRIMDLVGLQVLRNHVRVDGLDQIVKDPRRRLPRPVPTKETPILLMHPMKLHLLGVRHIPQQRVRPVRGLKLGEQPESLSPLQLRQGLDRSMINLRQHPSKPPVRGESNPLRTVTAIVRRPQNSASPISGLQRNAAYQHRPIGALLPGCCPGSWRWLVSSKEVAPLNAGDSMRMTGEPCPQGAGSPPVIRSPRSLPRGRETASNQVWVPELSPSWG